MAEMRRCAWARGEEMQRYHDEEWGRPCHDDGRLFEMLLLEGFQAGLLGHRAPEARGLPRGAGRL